MKKIEVRYAYGSLRKNALTTHFEVDEQLTPKEIQEFIRQEIIKGLEVDYTEVSEEKEKAQSFKFGG